MPKHRATAGSPFENYHPHLPLNRTAWSTYVCSHANLSLIDRKWLLRQKRKCRHAKMSSSLLRGVVALEHFFPKHVRAPPSRMCVRAGGCVFICLRKNTPWKIIEIAFDEREEIGYVMITWRGKTDERTKNISLAFKTLWHKVDVSRDLEFMLLLLLSHDYVGPV